MLKIEKMFAFIATEQDGEGVTAFMGPNNVWYPMVAADEARILSLRGKAQEIATASGRVVTLAEFSVREDVEMFAPETVSGEGYRRQ